MADGEDTRAQEARLLNDDGKAEDEKGDVNIGIARLLYSWYTQVWFCSPKRSNFTKNERIYVIALTI